MLKPSTQLHVGGKHVVFGMHWRRLAGDESERAEIRGLGAEVDATAYVKVDYHGDQSAVGLFKPVKEGAKPPTGAFSAAALFAAQHPGETALMFIRVPEEGRVALVGLVDGAPAVGFDDVGQVDAMHERAMDFFGSQSNSTRDIRIYTDTEKFDSREPQAFALENLLEPKARKEAVLHRIPGAFAMKWVFVVVFLAAALAYNHWLDEQKEQARLARLAAMKTVDPNQVYRQNVSNELRSAGPTVKRMLTGVMGSVREWETDQGGWLLDEVRCRPSGCTVKWTRSLPGLSYNDFLRHHRRSGALNFPADGLTIQENLPLSIQGGDLRLEDVLDESRGLPKAVSPLQSHAPVGLTFNIAIPSAIGLSGVPNPAAIKDPHVKAGKFVISGNLAVLDVLMDMAAAFTVDGVTMSIQNKTFIVEGKYYVR